MLLIYVYIDHYFQVLSLIVNSVDSKSSAFREGVDQIYSLSSHPPQISSFLFAPTLSKTKWSDLRRNHRNHQHHFWQKTTTEASITSSLTATTTTRSVTSVLSFGSTIVSSLTCSHSYQMVQICNISYTSPLLLYPPPPPFPFCLFLYFFKVSCVFLCCGIISNATVCLCLTCNFFKNNVCFNIFLK